MNVLILTDFSEISINAAEYSLQLLRKVPANFHLLNIETGCSDIETGCSDFGKNNFVEREVQARERLQGRFDALRSITSNKQHCFEAHFARDNLVSAARRSVEEKKIDLIIMGAVRKDFSQHTLLVNHPYEIIKKVKCNILAIPENSRFVKPREIVIPIDYSVSLDKKVFQVLNRPDMATKTSFTVLQVKDKPVPLAGVPASDKSLFHPLQKRKLHFSEINASAIAAKEEFLKVQRGFQMIVLLGRNLNICDSLLHTEHGLYSSVENRLPILVLHN